MLSLLIRALIEALVRQIPTFVEMIAKARARSSASQDQQAKDARNEKAIADALKTDLSRQSSAGATAENPPP